MRALPTVSPGSSVHGRAAKIAEAHIDCRGTTDIGATVFSIVRPLALAARQHQDDRHDLTNVSRDGRHQHGEQPVGQASGQLSASGYQLTNATRRSAGA